MHACLVSAVAVRVLMLVGLSILDDDATSRQFTTVFLVAMCRADNLWTNQSDKYAAVPFMCIVWAAIMLVPCIWALPSQLAYLLWG